MKPGNSNPISSSIDPCFRGSNKYLCSAKPVPLGRKVIEECFIRSWWVWGFAFLVVALSADEMRQKSQDEKHLIEKLERLSGKLEEVKAMHEDLQLQVSSLQDPASIELMLMHEMGLIPEGQVKVYFKKGK